MEKFSQQTDQIVVERWIYGDSTPEIEKSQGMSHGAVMNRIGMIREQLGKRQVEAIRVVTVALKKNRIRVDMVITASRIASILRRMKIDDGNFMERS